MLNLNTYAWIKLIYITFSSKNKKKTTKYLVLCNLKIVTSVCTMAYHHVLDSKTGFIYISYIFFHLYYCWCFLLNSSHRVYESGVKCSVALKNNNIKTAQPHRIEFILVEQSNLAILRVGPIELILFSEARCYRSSFLEILHRMDRDYRVRAEFCRACNMKSTMGNVSWAQQNSKHRKRSNRIRCILHTIRLKVIFETVHSIWLFRRICPWISTFGKIYQSGRIMWQWWVVLKLLLQVVKSDGIKRDWI